jgi:hypothetical protein
MYRISSSPHGRQAKPNVDNPDRDGSHRPSGGLEPPLSAVERRNIALASLAIMERRYRLRLAEIALERRSILAGQSQ